MAARPAFISLMKALRLQEEIRSELETRKVFVQGCDKHGRAIIYLMASRHSRSSRDLEETKRLICYSLDTQIEFHDLQRNPDGKGVGIFDMRGMRQNMQVYLHCSPYVYAQKCFRHSLPFLDWFGDRHDVCKPAFADITLDTLDFGALHAVFDLLQNHYPER
jgi:hypothetical protein